MSIGIAYNPCKNCKEMDKCSICELTYYRKGYIKCIYIGETDEDCDRQQFADALSLIKELTEEVESLKQCLEHEHASFMETFGELDDKCKRLTEENERLKQEG